jgi:hypothetical protein
MISVNERAEYALRSVSSDREHIAGFRSAYVNLRILRFCRLKGAAFVRALCVMTEISFRFIPI